MSGSYAGVVVKNETFMAYMNESYMNCGRNIKWIQ